MVTPPHSSLSSSLSDALNHCLDPLAVQALAGKRIASRLPERLTSFSLQTDHGWTDCTVAEMLGLGCRTEGVTQIPATSRCTGEGLIKAGLSQPPCPLLPSPSLLQPTPHSLEGWQVLGPIHLYTLHPKSLNLLAPPSNQVAELSTCSQPHHVFSSKDKIYPPDFQ